jgi:hypothetical protein
MPDPLFADLYRDTERLTWVPMEQVRRRARQRVQRTRIAAGLASVMAVAVVVTGAAALASRPDAAPPIVPATESPHPAPTPSPTHTPTPSAEPSRTRTPTNPTGTPTTSPSSSRPSTDPAIPASAMLQLADLPAGFDLTEGEPDGDWSLESVAIYCRNESPSISVGEVARRGRFFDSVTDRMTQRVTRHSGENAATAMDRIRELVTGCVPSRQGDSLSILADGLGGDEALMVGWKDERALSRWLFVRQGDLVAQVWLGSLFLPLPKDVVGTDERRYAQSVAERLCAGTDAC